MIASALFLLLQAASGAAPAQGGDPKHELRIEMELDAAFIAAADRNGDGALSLAEFQDEMDRRVDKAIANNPAARQKLGPAERIKMRNAMFAPSFRGFDRNSDGLLTAAEVKEGAQNK